MSDLPTTSSTINDWVQQYSDGLYAWALHKTSHRETAEDLVQETFLSALKSIEKFKNESSPKTWLMSILNNKINDHFRKAYHSPTENSASIYALFFDSKEHWTDDEAPHPWDETEHLLDNHEFQKELATCLQKLPPNWFSAVQLKFIEEKKGEEICQELNITPTNFWQVLHRAKLQLRKCLDVNWFNA